MNKAQFVRLLASKNQITRVQAEAFLNTFIHVIKKTVKKGEEVKIARFGCWYIAKRKARESRNPQTGAMMKIPATRIPSFHSSRTLKDACN
ncbi:MAG: HU family DNA-binding protein [Deltaproteobacteria bacterium]